MVYVYTVDTTTPRFTPRRQGATHGISYAIGMESDFVLGGRAEAGICAGRSTATGWLSRRYRARGRYWPRVSSVRAWFNRKDKPNNNNPTPT